MMSVLVAGDAFVDIVARGMTRLPELGMEELVNAVEFQPGGSAAYVATALRMFSQSVSLYSMIGNDSWGALWTERLTGLGVDVVAQKSDAAPTGLSIVLPVEGDRSFVTVSGANTLSRRLPREKRFTHVVLSGILQAPGLWSSEVLNDLSWYRKRSVPIFIDGNWCEEKQGQRFLQAAAGRATALFLNHREIAMLTGEDNPVRAGRALLRTNPDLVTVIKLGVEGAVAVSKDGTWHKAGSRVGTVVDSNGAGDVFLAAFTFAYRSRLGFPEALAFSNRAAALAISCSSYDARLNTLKRTEREAAGSTVAADAA